MCVLALDRSHRQDTARKGRVGPRVSGRLMYVLLGTRVQTVVWSTYLETVSQVLLPLLALY